METITEKVKEEVQPVEKSEVEKAKDVLLEADKKLMEQAIEVFKVAAKEIDAMGFSIVCKGEFLGNQFKSAIAIVSK